MTSYTIHQTLEKGKHNQSQDNGNQLEVLKLRVVKEKPLEHLMGI